MLASTGEKSSSGGSIISLLFLPLMFVGIYFLMIRPQRRRMKQQSAMQSALAEGDEVITTSGMYGFITGFEGDIVWLEIDDNIQIRVARGAVQRKVDTSAAAAPAVTESPKSTPASSTEIDELTDDLK
ncbi:MAG TPA: preprotein translocase subunit YajC, partial [Ilumatobacteraceae bacterium]|nr:preprotein translocase subunit YajC [Ilumatobacteraceae bacterium]